MALRRPPCGDFSQTLKKMVLLFFLTALLSLIFFKNLKMAISTLFSNKIGLLRVLLHNKLLKFVM